MAHLTSKQTPASLPGICAPREELLRIFNECAKKRYIYIQAPAGHGKTISSLLWLKKARRPFAWLSLDKYDNIPSLFYRALCQSLLTVSPQEEAVTQLVSSPAFSTSPVEITMDFLSLFKWNEGEYALILDDLHTVTNEEILKSLPFVLNRLPSSMNTLLLSRTALPGAMRALTENDKTSFIGVSELAFTPEEIRKYYASYGRFLTADEASDIHAYTDGWVIILSAMVIKGSLEPSNENRKLSFEEYFERNIWNGFDEATQIFLMKTSVVNSFTLELCERMTESLNCADTLDTLIRGNINLSCLGNEYRYHNLFLDFFRERLQKSGIEQSKLYYAATSYYMETEKFYLAVVYSLRGDDKEIESHVIGNFFKSKSPTLGQFYELSKAYDFLTKEQCDEHPIRYIPNILAAFLSGDADKMKRLFDLFYAALPGFLGYNHPIGDVAVTRLILDTRVKLAELPAFIDSLGLNRENSVPGQSALVTLQMPMPHRSIRDFSEFLDENTRDVIQDFFSNLLPGDSECFYRGVTAGLLMEQNRLNEAYDVALGAYSALTENSSKGVTFGTSVVLAETLLLKSDMDQSVSVIARLRQWIEKNSAQYLLKNLTAYEKRAKLWSCDTEAAESWLENYYVNDSLLSELYKTYQSFTTARAYIVLSMPDRAAIVLERLHKLGADMNRPLDVAEAGVLLSITEWVSGNKKEARDRLHGVLADIHSYGYVRVAANEGKAILPVLSAVIKKMDRDADKDSSLYRYAKEIYVAAYEQSRRYKGLTYNSISAAVKLSRRQALILDLLSKGYRNAEIVETTGLSLNTIRTHTKLAYRKLDVMNAMDAIIKAKQLGLLK